MMKKSSIMVVDGGSVTCNGDIFYTVNTPYGHTHPAQPYSITIKCSEPLKLRHRAFSFSLVQFSDQRYYNSYN